MAASHSSASPKTDSTTEHTQQAGTSGAAPAAGMQQLFDAWMGAWRSLGTPPGSNGMPFPVPQMPLQAPFQMPQTGLPQMPSFPGMPDFARLAAGSMPAMPSFAGLNIPSAAIPS